MKKLIGIAAIMVALLVAVSPAKAESITLSLNGTSQGVFNCTGTNGCFGNDITLDVSGSGTNWTVTLIFNTTNNTNPGDGIGAVSFILTGFGPGSGVSLTAAPGGTSAWTTSAGPANASGSGCSNTATNSICSFDTSAIQFSTGLDASPLGPGNTYTWEWTITGQTFGGFDSSTHVQALFGELIGTGGSGCPGGPTAAPCFKQTGLISSSTGTVPEPSTLALLGIGLLGLAGAARRRFLA